MHESPLKLDTKLQADGARVLPTADAGARPLYRIAVAVCLLLGVAVRVYGAWAGRYITDPDSSVVALMVKHMAAGAARRRASAVQ
ncbi:MAG: hypothetical protein O3B24_07690 [Verrucomicrobia bacterium]|nr:hypothetical protein [Verrucomicrobiota bacterium]